MENGLSFGVLEFWEYIPHNLLKCEFRGMFYIRDITPKPPTMGLHWTWMFPNRLITGTNRPLFKWAAHTGDSEWAEFK